MKLDYNIINDDIWMKQGENKFEIHYKNQKILVDVEDIPLLIKGLQGFYSSDTRTALRMLNK